MDSKGHREFAERIMGTLEKLGPEDYEMTIEGAMLAATHWVNYALHEFGVTDADDDVQHTYFLSGNDWQKYGIVAEELLQALDEIEKTRPMYVRGDVAGGEKAATRACELLARSKELALAAEPFSAL